MVQLTCPLCPSHKPDVQRLSGSLGHLCVCVFTLAESKAILQTDERQRRTLTANRDHNTRNRSWINSALQRSDSPATLDPCQHHSAQWVQANLANSSAPALLPCSPRSDSAVGVSPGLSYSQGSHSWLKDVEFGPGDDIYLQYDIEQWMGLDRLPLDHGFQGFHTFTPVLAEDF